VAGELEGEAPVLGVQVRFCSVQGCGMQGVQRHLEWILCVRAGCGRTATTTCWWKSTTHGARPYGALWSRAADLQSTEQPGAKRRFKETYDSLSFPVMKADACRYLYMHRYGGAVNKPSAAAQQRALKTVLASKVSAICSPHAQRLHAPKRRAASLPVNRSTIQDAVPERVRASTGQAHMVLLGVPVAHTQTAPSPSSACRQACTRTWTLRRCATSGRCLWATGWCWRP